MNKFYLLSVALGLIIFGFSNGQLEAAESKLSHDPCHDCCHRAQVACFEECRKFFPFHDTIAEDICGAVTDKCLGIK